MSILATVAGTGLVSTIKDVVGDAASLVKDYKRANAYMEGGSIADLAKMTQVEPTVIVSPDCINLDYMPQVQQSILSLFCAYYLQAVDILSSVEGAQPLKVLDSLNPNRDSTGFVLTMKNESNLKYSLPLPGQKLHMEALPVGDSKLSLHDAVNLSVGRLIEVTVAVKTDEGDERRSFKVQVRLMVSSIPESSIATILTGGTEDRGVMERFHAWRSGKLKFIRDIILCQDLIDAKYKMAVNDTSGRAAELLSRVTQNKRYGVLTQNPSMATASNVFVISEELASQLEYKLGGKLTDYRVRQKMFKESYAMIVVVINRETSRMKFYVRGQTDYATLSRKEIESMSKGGKGPDIMELFRSLQTASFSNF